MTEASMTPSEYKAAFRTFVLKECHNFYEGVKPWYLAESGQPDSLLYFEQQFPRIWAIIEMLKDKISPSILRRLCELGSFYPYVTLYFLGPIDLYDLVPIICPTAKSYCRGRVQLYPFNLCTDEFPAGRRYDLITLSEVLEHLPCNLTKVQRKVIEILNPGGLLLVSYPCQYQNNAEGYDREVGDPLIMYGRHLREFTPETTGLFFNDLPILDERSVTYPAYGKTILVLYQKP